jgi:hypothetical protein
MVSRMRAAQRTRVNPDDHDDHSPGTLRSRMEQTEAARHVLGHVASHHVEAPDGCPHYEALIWDRYRTSGT